MSPVLNNRTEEINTKAVCMIVIWKEHDINVRVLRCVLHLPGKQVLVKDEVSLLVVVDDVQLADAAKILAVIAPTAIPGK